MRRAALAAPNHRAPQVTTGVPHHTRWVYQGWYSRTHHPLNLSVTKPDQTRSGVSVSDFLKVFYR
jgi:hypothetical protein